MTPAEQIAALPEAHQEELWNVARSAIGMSREEKTRVLELLELVIQTLVTTNPQPEPGHPPVVHMFAACAELIAQIDRQAHPRQEGGMS